MQVLSEGLIRHIGLEVARGLQSIHKEGIVHRDIKPENIIVMDDGDVRLMDLGVACLRSETMLLEADAKFAGSLLYAAPEQLLCLPPEFRTDLYSLGVVMFELATGVHPFRSDDPETTIRHALEESHPAAREIQPQVSVFLEQLLQFALYG